MRIKTFGWAARWSVAAVLVGAWLWPAFAWAQESSQAAGQAPVVVQGREQNAPPVAPTPPRTVGPRAGGRAAASAPQAPGVRTADGAAGEVAADTQDDEDRERDFQNARAVVRIGQSHVVAEGADVREAVIIAGELTVNGRVLRDAVVIGGTVRLGPNARVGGDLVAIGGAVVIAEGAEVSGDVVVVGGVLQAPPSFSSGGDRVIIGTEVMGHVVERALPWVTYGLMLGRPIVPSLGWMWAVIAVVFFVYLVVGLLLERPVRACTEALFAKPLSTFLVGLLVFLLTGPVFFILAVSVVGIVVIPFALCGLFIASLLGRVAVSRAIGATILPEEMPGDRFAAGRSFAIGFAIVILAYMIPILGFVTYMIVGVFGMGAATMALVAGLRRENPAKPRPTPLMPPPMPTHEPDGGVSSSSAPLSAGADGAAAFSDAPPSGAFDHPHVASAYAGAAGGGVAAAAVLAAMPKASFLERTGAFVVDVIAVGVFMSLFGDMDSPRPFFLMLLVYHVVFWTLKGTTMGGMLFNLRVIKTSGEPVGFGDATVRGLSAILSLAVLFIGAIWILFDPDRQAWHDRFAGTYVVKVPREWRG